MGKDVGGFGLTMTEVGGCGNDVVDLTMVDVGGLGRDWWSGGGGGGWWEWEDAG